MNNRVEIRQLRIIGFRGIEDLAWNPEPGINVILGGGDCGKTTILEALSTLFSPSSMFVLTEADFWNRESENGFTIEAVISVADDFDFTSGHKIYWPWEWSGENAVVPAADTDDVPETQHPVFKIAVSASGEFDLSWEIIQPDESREHFPAGLRRRIGLVKLSGDERNDRDLRLVYGSALDRLLSDNSLRSKIGHAISEIPLTDSLDDEAKTALGELDNTLESEHLPSGLDLGVTGSQGISFGALIGLLAEKGDVQLPLASWGTGTRRMAALQISAANNREARITTVDEIERGLEPYRLRQLIRSLLASDAQSFVTTHSPLAISYSQGAQLWYLDASGNLGKLDRKKTSIQQKRDPETFLSRISVIVEGETEVGFVSAVLEFLFSNNLLDAGLRVCLGQGDDQLLALLESLESAGIRFAGFADNDGRYPERWVKLKTEMQDRLFHWETGSIETNILQLLPDEYMENLFKDTDGDWDGDRLRTVAVRLGIQEKSFTEIQAASVSTDKDLKEVIIEAATGYNAGVEDEGERKSWKKHARNWFKKADGSGGRELLNHLKVSGKWDELEPELRPFFNSILELSGKETVRRICV